MLLEREKEGKKLKTKIETSFKNNIPLSIYISGTPGTGKTATTKAIIHELQKTHGIQYIYINCVGTNKKSDIEREILKELKIFPARANLYAVELTKAFSNLQRKLIIVLDEIDHLNAGKNSFLLSAFQWPKNSDSQVVLIGIANSFDLTKRLLPGLKFKDIQPELFSFEPYNKDQIVNILINHLSSQCVGNEKAIELCARKVASQTGDIRFALNAATIALKEMVDDEEQENQTFGTLPVGLATPKKNNVRTVMGIFNAVQASPLLRSNLPEHSRIFLATLIKLVGNTKSKATTKARLINAYEKVCKNLKIPLVCGDERIRALDILETIAVMSCKGTGSQAKIIFIDEIAQARAKVADSNLVASIDEMDLS